MDMTSNPEKFSHYLTANALVEEWMTEYRRYLLDGDPNIVHPKAKAALVLAMVEAFGKIAQPPLPAKPKPRAKVDKVDDAKT